MKPLEVIGRTQAADGTELVLYHRDGSYQIRVNGLELMTSRAHGSEDALARLACTGLQTPAPQVLVGGLGMGFTLRAALDCLPARASVVVAEVFPAVVEWGRGPLAELAGRPLEDPRVAVEVADVKQVLSSSCERFDAILLDVDNGPDALTLAANDDLYQARGLRSIHRALRPGGVLAVWSADPDQAFARRMRRCGFTVRCETVRARAHGKGPRHTIFLATRLGKRSGGGRHC
jgi:spermidine synthase